MTTEMTNKAEAFANSCGVEYSAEFVPFSQSRNAGDKQPSLNWRVTLRKGSLTLTTDYMQGVGHLPGYRHDRSSKVDYDTAIHMACESGKWRIGQDGWPTTFCLTPIPSPPLVDVLACLVMDADVLNYSTFEEWAESLGYDPDSRKAEATYQVCLSIALKLRQMIDLDQAREAFEEW